MGVRVSGLNNEELARLLEAVAKMSAVAGVEDFYAHVVRATRTLMGDAYVACEMYDTVTMARLDGLIVPEQPITPKLLDAFLAHTHEHLGIEKLFNSKRPTVVTMGVYDGLPEFKSMGIYEEFYKHLGITDQVALMTPWDQSLAVTLAFSRDRSYSPIEELSAKLLLPHFITAWQNWSALRTAEAALAHREAALSEVGVGVIEVDERGRILTRCEPAESLLTCYTAQSRRERGALPRAVQRWVVEQSGRLAQQPGYRPEPWALQTDAAVLRVRLVPGEKEGRYLLVLREQRAAPRPTDLERLGLTRTQALVLHAIMQGKTNKQIGGEMKISPRTVGSHLEAIYRTLGVSNRTEAAAVARAPVR